MQKISDILEKVKSHPEMYIGGSNDNREEQLRNLQWFIMGYQAAYGIGTPEGKFMIEFGAYLTSKYKWSMSCGPIHAILNSSETPEKAWDLWWREIEDWKPNKK